MIRLTVPSIEEDDLDAVRKVLASGFLVQGAQVAAFEKAIADYVGTKYAVAVCNCTAALHLGLLALGVQSGDVVAVASYSWPATANVIELCGAQPLFVDIDPQTYNMDPASLKFALQKAMLQPGTNRVKAILPVHTFGQMADMPAIMRIAAQYNLPVVEDAACALGASFDEKPAGTYGLMGCFSFHPRKAITTGEGGVIVTNDDRLARTLRSLRNHGQDPDATAPDFVRPGFNLRLTEFQAALGITQLNKVDRIIRGRRAAAKHYDKLLTGKPVTAPIEAKGATHVYQSYVTLLPAELACCRAQIIQRLKDAAVEVTIGTYNIPSISYYRDRYEFGAGDYPQTDDIASRAISLPLYESISEQEQKKVIDVLTQLIRAEIAEA